MGMSRTKQDRELTVLSLVLSFLHRDTSNAPAQITNGKGLIILRKSGITTPGE